MDKDKDAARQGEHSTVVCICRGIGFPYGLAQTHRIRMVGRAAIAQGLGFTVLHIGGSPNSHNEQVSGEYEGIDYHYLPGRVQKPANPLLRRLDYVFGTCLALSTVAKLRGRSVCVYAWVGRGTYGAFVKGCLRVLGVPVVQEVNEWWPGPFEWMKNAASLALSDGTIAISRDIEKRLKELCSRYRLSNRIVRIPVLADPVEHGAPEQTAQGSTPYVLWCGNIDGYMADVRFMLQALKDVLAKGHDCRLVLVGAGSAQAKQSVAECARECSLPEKSVRLAGYVTDQELKVLMAGARALLLPLWDDDRSRCRFPNKIGEYLFCRRPVITCGVGDINDLLVDGDSAHVCSPGDVRGFAERICRVLDDPDEAERMSERGRAQAIKRLDWRENAGTLSELFATLAARKG